MDYVRPSLLFNCHVETIFPATFRKVSLISPQRLRFDTPDQDFLDVDWYSIKSSSLVIISHGLEGNSKRAYVLGMAKAMLQNGMDVLAWNYRGCSEEMNRSQRFYHSGATDDLDTIVKNATNLHNYEEIYLVGFSLGGNITLKYLGERFDSVRRISKAIAISVPLDLGTSCDTISKPSNWLYEQRFLRSLKKKVVEKNKQMNIPGTDKLQSIKKLRQFDDLITGPLHGFKDANEYYDKCSSINFLGEIKSKTLIINAKNDPFLSSNCFPKSINNPMVTSQYPEHGGHVGFTQFYKNGLYWSEMCALQFITGSNV